MSLSRSKEGTSGRVPFLSRTNTSLGALLCTLHPLPRAALTKDTKWGAYTAGMYVLLCWKLEVHDEVSVGLGPEGREGESGQTPLLAFGGLLAILGAPWLVETSAKIHLLLCMCAWHWVRISPFYENTSGIRLGPTPVTSF